MVQLVAGGAALLGASALYLCERRWEETQEALIGTVFILAATGGILLLARNPHGGEHLLGLPSGPAVVWSLAVTGIVVRLAIGGRDRD